MRNPFRAGQYAHAARSNPDFQTSDLAFHSVRLGLPNSVMRQFGRRNPNTAPNGNVTYGPKMKGSEIYAFLGKLFKNNEAIVARGDVPTPICIWGSHGIGKTSFVKQFCDSQTNGPGPNGAWLYEEIAPAQFEEMGDFHGLPIVGKDKTTYAKPEWAPVKDGPGILLVDDFNRADGRILRGLMQFFQRGGLISWKLPKYWQIVCTANPEGGEYRLRHAHAHDSRDDGIRFGHLAKLGTFTCRWFRSALCGCHACFGRRQ